MKRICSLVLLLVMSTGCIFAQFSKVGDAYFITGSEYRLTSALPNQSGAIWNQEKLNLNIDFRLAVQMRFSEDVTNSPGADGMAFVLQPLGLQEGGDGGQMGYGGIQKSFIVEFDTYQNSAPGDPTVGNGDPQFSLDHIAFAQNGNVEHNLSNPVTGPIPAARYVIPYPSPYIVGPNEDMEDGNWHDVVFEWNAATKTIKVSYDSKAPLTLTYDLTSKIFNGNPMVYWGFTGGTGAEFNDQRVRIISFKTTDCGFQTLNGYYGGFELGANNITPLTGGSDLYNGLPRNGSYEIVKKVSDLGGGGYLDIQPKSGSYLFAAHTSNNAADRVWYAKVPTVPGKRYSFCANARLLKNLGNGAKFILGVYANGKELNTGVVSFDWTSICGSFTATSTTTELSVRDPKKGLFFVALDDICVTPEATTPVAPVRPAADRVASKSLTATSQLLAEELTVKAFPNPAASAFNISIQSNDESKASIRITDAFGRTITMLKDVEVNSKLSIGSDLKPGTYFAEVTQGSVKRLVKLVKL